EQDVLVHSDRVFQQPVHHDHIHAGQLRQVGDLVKRAAAAVYDHLELQLLDVGARAAFAEAGKRQLRDFVREHVEETQHACAKVFGARSKCVVFDRVEEDGVAFQLRQRERKLDFVENRFN